MLVPFGDYVAVSKKIWSARERKRLQTLGRSLLPEGFGLIIRTVASGKDAKTLHADMSLLVQKWERIKVKLESKPSPPKPLHQDVSMVSSVIRDLFTDDYERILIDDQRLFRSVQTYIRAVAPDMLPAVERHDGRSPVFGAVGIEGAIVEAFSSRVDLPSGGYLIIEHTEAMHVIDVNSGRSTGESQEENSLKVDLEAASAIAHQLRLRDLGGIIVVDFIDLREDRNRSKVVNRMKQEFRKDRAVTKVLPMSDFGLIQITRQRLRPSITTDEAAREAELATVSDERAVSSSKATQARRPSVELLVSRLDRDLASLRKSGNRGHVKLRVHPFFAAYLTKGFPNKLSRLWLKHRFKVEIEEDESQSAITYDLIAQTRPANERRRQSTDPAEKTPDKRASAPSPDASPSRRPSDKGRGSSNRSGRNRSGRAKSSNRHAGGNRSGGKQPGQTQSGGTRSGSKHPGAGQSGAEQPKAKRAGTGQARGKQSGRSRSGSGRSGQGDSGRNNAGRHKSGRNQSRRSGGNQNDGSQRNRPQDEPKA